MGGNRSVGKGWTHHLNTLLHSASSYQIKSLLPTHNIYTMKFEFLQPSPTRAPCFISKTFFGHPNSRSLFTRKEAVIGFWRSFFSFTEPSSKIFHSHRRLRQCGKGNGQPTHERQVHCLSSSQDQDLGEDIPWDSSFSPSSSVRETWWNPWFPGGNVGWELTCGSGQRSEVLLIPGDS